MAKLPIQTLPKQLKQVSQLFHKAYSTQLSELGLDNHAELLLLIAEQEKPFSQNQLAELFQIDKSRMVGILFNLSQKGIVQILRNPKDRRENLVYLCPKAQNLVPEIANILLETTKCACNGISTEKLNCFFDVLERLHHNLLDQGRGTAG